MMKKSKNEIDGLIVSLCNEAQNIMERDGGDLDPVAFLITRDNKLIPCMLPCNGEGEKRAMHLALGAAMKELKAFRVILISDAAMRALSPEKYEEFKKNYETEQPLMYPESMRQDGIFVQDIDVEKSFSNGYFMRYENLKDAPRLYHNLYHINKGKETMGGDLFDWVLEGYKDSDKFPGGIEMKKILSDSPDESDDSESFPGTPFSGFSPFPGGS